MVLQLIVYEQPIIKCQQKASFSFLSFFTKHASGSRFTTANLDVPGRQRSKTVSDPSQENQSSYCSWCYDTTTIHCWQQVHDCMPALSCDLKVQPVRQ